MPDFYRKKRKRCRLCDGKGINYKDKEAIKRFINEKGKILPRRVTGTCAKHQRLVATEIKRARLMGIIPFVN